MRLNETVSGIVASSRWNRSRTLIEVAQAGDLFIITEAEFDRLLEAERIDEGFKEIIQKARAMAAKLPADIKQASQLVAQKTGKALDSANAAYVKAQNLIDKIPLIGRIPQNTRNRLILGLALSFAAGMGTTASAGEDGGHDMGGHHDATGAHAGGDHATAGNEGGDHAGGEHPAPQPKVEVFHADLSGVDVRKEMVDLKKNLLQTIGDKVYTDQFMTRELQQMLMAAKKAGTVSDPEEKKQLIGLAKQMAKGILYRTEEGKTDAVMDILVKATVAAFKAGKGTP